MPLALGGRVERQSGDLDRGDSRALTGLSGAAGLTVRAKDGLAFRLTLSYSERLPGAEGLFSDGEPRPRRSSPTRWKSAISSTR